MYTCSILCARKKKKAQSNGEQMKNDVDRIQLRIVSSKIATPEWVEFMVGDDVPLDDGIYFGAKGSAVVLEGVLVAAWNIPKKIIPTIGVGAGVDEQVNLEDTVAHITIESLKEACRKERLNWELDCLTRFRELVDLVSLEIDPVEICMLAAIKFKQLIKEGRI